VAGRRRGTQRLRDRPGGARRVPPPPRTMTNPEERARDWVWRRDGAGLAARRRFPRGEAGRAASPAGRWGLGQRRCSQRRDGVRRHPPGDVPVGAGLAALAPGGVRVTGGFARVCEAGRARGGDGGGNPMEAGDPHGRPCPRRPVALSARPASGRRAGRRGRAGGRGLRRPPVPPAAPPPAPGARPARPSRPLSPPSPPPRIWSPDAHRHPSPRARAPAGCAGAAGDGGGPGPSPGAARRGGGWGAAG
jgi:hypothetical protein